MYREVNLVGGYVGREIILRKIFLYEKKEPSNEIEIFSFFPYLL